MSIWHLYIRGQHDIINKKHHGNSWNMTIEINHKRYILNSKEVNFSNIFVDLKTKLSQRIIQIIYLKELLL